jgi:two-component system sensor histidine kinase KdpD
MHNSHNSAASRTGEATSSVRIGQLTVFLGAAPGAGKTYAMLGRAHELLQQGKDIIVGALKAYQHPICHKHL